MRSMVVQRLCLLALLFCRVVAEEPPSAILINTVDSTPVTLRSQVATFGYQFQDSKYLETLLMLPPDEPHLCVFPTSLKNMTSLEAQNLTMGRPFALLVARGDCAFDQKALMVAAIQERFTPFLKYMIVYNTNSSQPDDLIYMSNSTPEGLESVGATFLSWNSGVMLLDKVNNYSNQTGLSSTFLSETSKGWDLRVTLEVIYPSNDDQQPGSDSELSHSRNAFYSMRFVLFTLIIVEFSPR